MKLSVELLIAAFLQEHPAAEVYQAFRGFEVSGVRLLPPNRADCGGQFLYVTDGAALRMHRGAGLEAAVPGSHILCFLRSGDWLPLPGVMQIASALGLAEAMNALQSVFSLFSDWKQELELALLRSPEPQRLLDLTDPVLRCPVLIYDPALKVLACSRTVPDGFEDPIFSSAVQEGYLDVQSFRFLEGNNYISEVKQRAFLDMEADEYQQHALRAAKINAGGELAAFCIMLYDRDVSRTYANYVFQLFCAYVKELLEFQKTELQQARNSFDYFLTDLLNNTNLSPEQIRDRLLLTGYHFEGDYVVLTLHARNTHRAPESYFINYLRFNLYQCQIFSYQQSIVILFPLSSGTARAYRQHLEKVFTPLLVDQADKDPSLFISRPFNQIELFSAAYLQAEHTAGLAKNTVGLLCYFYEDYWINDLFAENRTKEKLYCYCEPFVLDLMGKNSPRAKLELRILYEYLFHDRKLTYIAERLNMHRNNVIYHIKQIEDRYHIDLDAPDLRIKLRISMELLKYYHLL